MTRAVTKWSNTSKAKVASDSTPPNRLLPTIRWPEEDTGKNSVRPCIKPRNIASKKFMSGYYSIASFYYDIIRTLNLNKLRVIQV